MTAINEALIDRGMEPDKYSAIVLEAARRYANPNIEAAAARVRQHWVDEDLGPTDPFTPEELEMSLALAEAIVAAAFTPPGDKQ